MVSHDYGVTRLWCQQRLLPAAAGASSRCCCWLLPGAIWVVLAIESGATLSLNTHLEQKHNFCYVCLKVTSTLTAYLQQPSFLTWLMAIPPCCGPCFRNWEILPLRPSLSEMVRSGSLLVLGFSMAHFPNLQGILTSVGILSTLQGILLMRREESPAVEICFSQSTVHESLLHFFRTEHFFIISL